MNASDNSTQVEVTEIRSTVPVKVASFLQGNGSNGHLFKGEAVFLVKNVSLHDEDEYICEAFNKHGKVRCGAFLVVVEGNNSVHHCFMLQIVDVTPYRFLAFIHLHVTRNIRK